MLGISALMALSDAVAACGDGSVYPALEAPATAERVLAPCAGARRCLTGAQWGRAGAQGARRAGGDRRGRRIIPARAGGGDAGLGRGPVGHHRRRRAGAWRRRRGRGRCCVEGGGGGDAVRLGPRAGAVLWRGGDAGDRGLMRELPEPVTGDGGAAARGRAAEMPLAVRRVLALRAGPGRCARPASWCRAGWWNPRRCRRARSGSGARGMWAGLGRGAGPPARSGDHLGRHGGGPVSGRCPEGVTGVVPAADPGAFGGAMRRGMPNI
jgi:hypothetical protein